MRPVDKVALKVQKYLKQANKQASNREAGGGGRDMFSSQLEKHRLASQGVKLAGQPGDLAPSSRLDNRSRGGSGRRRGHTPGHH